MSAREFLFIGGAGDGMRKTLSTDRGYYKIEHAEPPMSAEVNHDPEVMNTSFIKVDTYVPDRLTYVGRHGREINLHFMKLPSMSMTDVLLKLFNGYSDQRLEIVDA